MHIGYVPFSFMSMCIPHRIASVIFLVLARRLPLLDETFKFECLIASPVAYIRPLVKRTVHQYCSLSQSLALF